MNNINKIRIILEKIFLRSRFILKYVLLSADSETSAYLVPDEVASNLRKYCIYFCDTWLKQSPNAKKYNVDDGLCYTEKDFIEYLNTWTSQKEESIFVESIGWIDSQKDIPKKYKGCPIFNF